MKVDGVPHRVKSVKLFELRVAIHPIPSAAIDGALVLGENQQGLLTAGKVSINHSMLSAETKSALDKFINLAERDLAATVFEVEEHEEAQQTEPVDSL